MYVSFHQQKQRRLSSQGIYLMPHWCPMVILCLGVRPWLLLFDLCLWYHDKQFSWKHSLCIIISQKVSIIADNALSLQNSILAEPRKTFVESGKNGSRRQKNYFCQLEHAARICPYNSTHPEYSCVEVSPIETN